MPDSSLPSTVVQERHVGGEILAYRRRSPQTAEVVERLESELGEIALLNANVEFER